METNSAMTVYHLKTDQNPATAVSSLLGRILSESLADAVLVSARTPHSPLPMPAVITDPDQIEAADPLAPAAPFNAARQAASILRHESGRRTVLVLRPCEIRALVELVKLKQCVLADTVIIGMECLGRMENPVYLEKAAENPDLTAAFYRDSGLQDAVCASCRICTRFLPRGADIAIQTIGEPTGEQIGIVPQTPAGKDLLERLGLTEGVDPAGRADAIRKMGETREQERTDAFRETAEKTDTIDKLEKYVAQCLNCYNCRVACPVCYCRECVFLTDVFAHDPQVLMRRAAKKGMIKLPADTTMFHLTRMAHMAHACVACGHCSSVCPSSIPVADIFIKVGDEVQKRYGYEPGRDPDEPMPLMVYDNASDT
jgi:formate dehydrogenase (coenzyme F420) beta subunit